MKDEILKFLRKYHITTAKIIIFAVILVVFVLRFLIQGHVFIKPILTLFDLYADFLIVQSKLFLHLASQSIQFDLVKNQIINNGHILTIDRFYFSINQAVALLVVVLVTKSPYLNKAISFIIAFLILTAYNSVRISLHAIYPETVAVHNWFFNLVLIPRWLIILGFAMYYWKKFPFILDQIKSKLGLSDGFIKQTFFRIAIIIVVYYLVIILVFNNYIFLNGTLLISFILNTCQYFIDLLGYECFVNNRLIYNSTTSLYMDDACMGIDLMFLFASFIALLPGALKHKLWYIPAGLAIIILLNCLRVVLIFINVSKTGAYTYSLEIHDLFTYPVLFFTFIMWVIWINKFYKKKPKSKIISSEGE